MKPILIFSPARTGSHLLWSIVRSYESKIFRISEYFDIKESYIIDTGIQIVSFRSNSDSQIKDKNTEIKKRIELLEKYKDQKIPIKITTSQINEMVFNYVKNEYKIVTINRKNKYEQLLSWLIARHSGQWTDRDKEKNKKLNLTVKVQNINRFVNLHIKLYESWRSKFLNEGILPTEFSYEELISDGDQYQNIIKKLGFKFDRRTIVDPPKKLHTLNEKEKLITNINEIKEYIKQNFSEYFYA